MRYLFIVLLGLSCSQGARASETSESASGIQKKFSESQAITDPELKSRAGSLSRLSLKFELNYAGPPVGEPGDADQPNPDQISTKTATGLSGSFGTRYRLSSEDSLTMNVGVTEDYLFHGSMQQLDVNDPFLTYDRNFRLFGIQFVASPSLAVITSHLSRSKGETIEADARLYSSYALGDSGLSISGTWKLQTYYFGRDYRAGGRRAAVPGDGRVRRYNINLSPGLKYALNRRLSLATSVHTSFINTRDRQSETTLDGRLVYERIGVGYNLTRDIYLNPYIQFFPSRFTWRTSTFNLATVVSLL